MTRLLLKDIPEKIETPRLILQMPTKGYGKQLHEAMIDGYEDYVRWLNWSTEPPTIDMLEEECRRLHAQFILREDIRYLIVCKSDMKVIGRCAFPSVLTIWPIPQFGISYFIGKQYRGNHYGREATHALTLIAFKALGAKKVEIHVDQENKASLSIPQQLNFELEYCKKGGWPRPDGQLAELVTYSMFDVEKLPPLEVRW